MMLTPPGAKSFAESSYVRSYVSNPEWIRLALLDLGKGWTKVRLHDRLFLTMELKFRLRCLCSWEKRSKNWVP